MKIVWKFIEDHDVEACIVVLSVCSILMFISTILFVYAR